MRKPSAKSNILKKSALQHSTVKEIKMEKLSTLVLLASEARINGHLYSSSAYARSALSLANKHKQMRLAGKLMLLCRRNSEDRAAGHGVKF